MLYNQGQTNQAQALALATLAKTALTLTTTATDTLPTSSPSKTTKRKDSGSQQNSPLVQPKRKEDLQYYHGVKGLRKRWRPTNPPLQPREARSRRKTTSPKEYAPAPEARPRRKTTAPKDKEPDPLPTNGLNKTGLARKGDKPKPPPPNSTGKTNAKGPKKETQKKIPKQDKSDSEDDENEDEDEDEDEDDVEEAGNDRRIRDSQKHTESTSNQKHKKKKIVAREDFVPETQVSSDDSASGSTSEGGTR